MMTPPQDECNSASQKGVTISIVSHGQAGLARKLLLNLEKTSSQLIERVVLTINIPEADSLLGIDLHYPVEIIKNIDPKGFGANHNAAFSHCTSDWFLVLNPDIELAIDPIARLLAQATPSTGMLAPRILEPGRLQPEPYRRLITPLEIVSRHIWSESAMRVRTPEWMPGMFMLLRTQTFAQLKGFDERYFMYVEDADLCARLKLANWKIKVVDNVTVVHDAQRASRRQWRALFWHLASLARWWISRAFWRALIARR